ncbi:MAG: hypothetical protein PVH91_13140 [Pseudomonadales bacterium]
MIYLILKMFVYLLLALLSGAAAGWLLRHLGAAKQEEDMQRTLADARSRVPQFESLIRSRDEQISRLKDDLKDKDARINALAADVRTAENAARDKDRELKQLAAQQATLNELKSADVTAPASETLVGGEVLDFGEDAATGPAGADAALKEKVVRLERELAVAKSQAADATAEAAAAEAEVITLKAELARAGTGGDTTDGKADQVLAELEKRLATKTMEYERLARDLEVEQRRVAELERERALQNKSLRVLHQQLELERERGQRVASG